MALNTTYDATLSRVRLAATSLTTAADLALFERSTDQIRWSTVRGGGAVPIVAGAASLDDYEFSPDVINYYRVSAVDTSLPSFIAAGTVASGNNTSVAPGIPAGLSTGDTMLCWAAIRNSGVGTVNTPAGWTPLLTTGTNRQLFGRRYVAGDTAPTITFTGGVANADTVARIVGFRNIEMLPAAALSQLNGSAQNINYPALTVPGDRHLVLYLGWKQAGWTSVAPIAGATEAYENPVTAGDDAGIVADYVIQTVAANIVAGSFVVTGGLAAISRGATAAFRPADFLTRDTASLTPTLGSVWLKSLTRPFLNLPVRTLGTVDPTARRSRGGLFDVVGRSFPVAVTDAMSSPSSGLNVHCADKPTRTAVDLLLSTGDPLLIHAPASSWVRTHYAMVTAAPASRMGLGDQSVYGLALTEVAAPTSDLVGATVIWANVIANFATWTDLIAAEATWADVLERIGDPTDVIVP